MTLLISVIITLLLAVTLLLFFPWSARYAVSRNRVNQALYHSRLRELYEDFSAADSVQRAQMETDLKQNLLDDIPVPPAPRDRNSPTSRWVLLPGVVALILISVGTYIKTGAIGETYLWQQVTDETPQLLQRLASPVAPPLGEADLARLALGLRTRLQNSPTNREGWSVLGRIGSVLGNATLATQAFEKAYRLAPENLDAKLDYAEILTQAGDAQDWAQAGLILQAARQSRPRDLRVLGLTAFNAFLQQRYSQAIWAWQQMLQLLPQDDPRRATLARSIAKANAESGSGGARLVVRVALAGPTQTPLPAAGALFITVTDGRSPTPVAVKKLPLGHFPVTVALSDDDVISPERLLSGLKAGIVTVRLSVSGGAERQSGDRYGQVAVKDFSAVTPVKVLVAQQQ